MLINILSVATEEELRQPLTGADAELEKKLREKILQMQQVKQKMKDVRSTMEKKKLENFTSVERSESVEIDTETLGAVESEIQKGADSMEQARIEDAESEKMPSLPEEEPVGIGVRKGSRKSVKQTLERMSSIKTEQSMDDIEIPTSNH